MSEVDSGNKMTFTLFEGRVVKQSSANLIIGCFARGGKLFLTESHLEFRPHWVEKLFCGRNHLIPLREIKKLEISNWLFFVKIFKIETSNKTYKFRVWDAQGWKTKIEELIQSWPR